GTRTSTRGSGGFATASSRCTRGSWMLNASRSSSSSSVRHRRTTPRWSSSTTADPDGDLAGPRAVTSERFFAARPGSVSEARRYVQQELVGEDRELIEAATLMVSELATNAVRHADSAFLVRVSKERDEVRFEVF